MTNTRSAKRKRDTRPAPGTDLRRPVLRLFGTPLVEAHGGRPAHLLERHDAALLAVIALEGPQDRARLAPLLWPDAADPRSHLRQRLHRLKHAVGHRLLTSAGPLAFLPDVDVDVDHLERDLRHDDAASRGSLLGDLDYSDIDTLDAWVRGARLAEGSRRAALLARLSSELEEGHALSGALRYAQRLVLDAPVLEHGHRRLMWLHYLRGDRAAALDAYARCCEVLAREVDQEPDDETRDLAQLITAGQGRSPIVPARKAALARPPRIVGREAVWLAYQRSQGDRTVLLVRGEAGIGKSRVLDELSLSIEGAAMTGAYPGDVRFAYATLGRLIDHIAKHFRPPATPWVLSELARIVPAFGPAPTDALDAGRVGRAFAKALADWSAAGLKSVLLDDLQHADAASIEALVPVLSRQARGTDPVIAWILAARPSDAPNVFFRWCEEAAGDDLTIVDLLPLDSDAIRELLRTLGRDDLDDPQWGAVLAKHTGGNPFYVLETVRAIAAEREAGRAVDVGEIPRAARVTMLIDRRLSLLSPRARKLAQIAAVAGLDFEVAIAADVLRCAVFDLAEPWAELERANVLSNDRFAHDLVFEAALRSVPGSIARTLHREVAAAMTSRDRQAKRIAEHWISAEAWPEAADALCRAAHDARTGSRRTEELELWTRCADAYERIDDADLSLRARCESCEAMLDTRPTDEVIALTQRLRGRAASRGQRLDVLIMLAAAHTSAANGAEGLMAAREALSLATDLSLSWLQFDAARYVAMCLGLEGRGGEGVELLSAFAAMIERSGNRKRRLKFHSDLAYLLILNDRATEAIVQTRLAIDDARAANDRSELLTGTTNLAALYWLLGEHEKAAAHSDEVCRILVEWGDARGVTTAIASANAGAHFLAVGRFDDALAMLSRSIAIHEDARVPDNYAAPFYTHLAHAYLQLGKPARARATLKPIPAGSGAMFDRDLRRACIEARISRQLDQSGNERIATCLAQPGKLTDRLVRFTAVLDVARTRPARDAIAECRAVRIEADAMGHETVALRARLLGIEAMGRAGHARAAAREARSAVSALSARSPTDLYTPEAFWIVYTALDGSLLEDDRQRASKALESAFRWIRERAWPHVPDEFKHSFLHENPVNRLVLRASADRLGLTLA